MSKATRGLTNLAILMVAAWLAAGAPALAAEPQPLQVYLFASSTCPECAAIKGELLPRVERAHGGRIKVTHHDLDDIENFKLLLLCEKRYGAKDDEALKVSSSAMRASPGPRRSRRISRRRWRSSSPRAR